MYPPHMGFQAFPGGPQGFPQGNPYQPQPSRPTPPPASKSDQPMVTIKRVMRPDTNEPTVTISVKKDEDGKEAKPAAQQQDKVLFTLVNGQVMKTANAPDNLIPGAKPMPTELAKRLMPDEGGDVKLSKKQKKKMASKGREAESASNSPAMQRAAAPAAPYQQVDLDKLRLPDGVSISKISGPVPERRYFPCKETDAAPRGPGAPGGQNPAPMGPPWTNNPYAAVPPPSYPGATGFPSSSYGGFGAAPPNSNVIGGHQLFGRERKSVEESEEKGRKESCRSCLSGCNPIISMGSSLHASTELDPRHWTRRHGSPAAGSCQAQRVDACSVWRLCPTRRRWWRRPGAHQVCERQGCDNACPWHRCHIDSTTHQLCFFCKCARTKEDFSSSSNSCPAFCHSH